MWGPDEWSAAAQMVTAGVALGAAEFARRQVGEARKTREAQAQPFVVVSLEPSEVDEQILDLVVENVGATLARDVSFAFNPPLRSSLKDDFLADSFLLRSGIPTMPPGMRLARVFDSALQREPTDLPWRFDVKVSFSDHRRRPQEPLEYVLDLEPYRSGTYLRLFTQHHAAEALRGMEATLNSIVQEKRLRVTVKDDDYATWSRRWQYDRSGMTPRLNNPTPAGRRSPSKYDHLEEPAWREHARSVWRRLRAKWGSAGER